MYPTQKTRGYFVSEMLSVVYSDCLAVGLWALGVLALLSQGLPERLIFLCISFATDLFSLYKKEQQLNLITSLFCVSILALVT